MFDPADAFPIKLQVDVLWNNIFGTKTYFSDEKEDEQQNSPITEDDNEQDDMEIENLSEKEIEKEEVTKNKNERDTLDFSTLPNIGNQENEINECDEFIQLHENSDSENYIESSNITSSNEINLMQKSQDKTLMERILQRAEIPKGAYSYEQIKISKNTNPTILTIDKLVQSNPLDYIGSKVKYTGHKRKRNNFSETERLLNKYVKRPCWKVPDFVNNNFDELHYSSPSIKFIEEDEEAHEVSISQEIQEKKLAKCKIREEICTYNNQQNYPIHCNEISSFSSIHKTTKSFVKNLTNYFSHDRLIAKRGFERFSIFNVPIMYHRMIQYQQYITNRLRFTEKFLYHYFTLCVGDYFNSCLNNPALPAFDVEMFNNLAPQLFDWCNNDLATSDFYKRLVFRFRNTNNVRAQEITNQIGDPKLNELRSTPPIKLLFDRFLKDRPKSSVEYEFIAPFRVENLPNQFIKDSSVIVDELFETGELDDILEKDSGESLNQHSSDTNEDEEMIDVEDNDNNDADFEDDEEYFPFQSTRESNLHPYFFAKNLRTFWESGKRVRHSWGDMDVTLLDEYDHHLRRFLHKIIGKAYIVAQERTKNSSAKKRKNKPVEVEDVSCIFLTLK